jgi:hypothetical protein
MNSISKNKLIYEAEFLATKLFRPKMYKLALLKIRSSLSATEPDGFNDFVALQCELKYYAG